jgi:dTDP-glucose 4,6-dehydratase
LPAGKLARVRILVTGGAGFIGSEYVRQLLSRPDADSVTVLDALAYSGVEANLEPVRDIPASGSTAATSATPRWWTR